MSFLMGQWKKQITNYKNKEENKKPLSHRIKYQKLFLNKYHNNLNFKENKKLTPKYNTLKNSRKLINHSFLPLQLSPQKDLKSIKNLKII